MTEQQAQEARALRVKQATQRLMAWLAFWSMIAFTSFLFTPIVSIERIDAISSLADVFYIAMASVVGAYMGVTAYMSRAGDQSYNSVRRHPNNDK